MPFELGIDYGCKRLNGDRWSEKKILILDSAQYRYQIAISDLSGSDIKRHEDQPHNIITAVRDWLVLSEGIDAVSGNRIWGAYNDLQGSLYDKFVEEDGHRSLEDVQEQEVISFMKRWIDQHI